MECLLCFSRIHPHFLQMMTTRFYQPAYFLLKMGKKQLRHERFARVFMHEYLVKQSEELVRKSAVQVAKLDVLLKRLHLRMNDCEKLIKKVERNLGKPRD